MYNNNPNKLNGTVSITRIITYLLVILIFVSAVYFIIGQYEGRKKESKARCFLKQAIKSINDHTVYYKNHSSTMALADIQKNIDKINNNYKIIIVDYDISYFEYNVFFDKKNRFYISVMLLDNGDFCLSRLVPD